MKIKKILVLFTAIIFFSLIGLVTLSEQASAIERKVYDEAGILNSREVEALESLATELGEQWDTDFLILTTNDTNGLYIKDYMANFYDEKITEQGLSKWNATILSLDMQSRDVYLSGFYKGELYIDGDRIDKILDEVAPYLSNGNYYEAFEEYLYQVNDYMGREPAKIYLQWWFQILVSLGIGALVVGGLAFNLGGRVTVTARTYLDERKSRVLQAKNQYVRTVVTKQKKPSSKSGGGGGGRTPGGHSFSGGGRKF